MGKGRYNHFILIVLGIVKMRFLKKLLEMALYRRGKGQRVRKNHGIFRGGSRPEAVRRLSAPAGIINMS